MNLKVSHMSSENIGVEEARKVLGDLVTKAEQGTDIILTRRGRPAARLTRYLEDTMVTIADITAELLLPASDAERVARFVGALEQHDPRTGRIPHAWTGQGMDATFSRSDADRLIAEWYRSEAMGPTSYPDGTLPTERMHTGHM